MSIPTITKEYYFPQRGSYENLKVKESTLRQPKSSEVLVKIHAVSLQYRDLMVAWDKYPARSMQENLVPCSDMAGEIVAAGDDVKGWKVGDRVCANFALDHIHGDVTPAIQDTGLGAQLHGVLTEYRIVPAYSLVRVPDHLSYEEASTLPCAALTAYNALLGLRPLKGGDTVLIQGTGGVSIFALQIAVASGATVIATSSSDEKLKIAEKLGAKYLINYKKTPNWDEKVLEYTNGRGVDHVIEVGGPGTLAKSYKAARVGGGIISAIGFVAKDKEEFDIGFAAIRTAITLRGIQIGSVAQFEDMNRLLSANQIHPVVDKVFPFEEAIKAYAYLDSQAHVGKVVIKVSKN